MDKYAEDIKKMPSQLLWEPIVENAGKLAKLDRHAVGGMGGSHLGADFLKAIYPELDLVIHEDYGLPILPRGGDEGRLYIAASYSGNTEETLDFAKSALEAGLPLATISKGGKLEAFAKDKSLPYVALPDMGLEPRMATGLMMRALLALFGDEGKAEELKQAAGAVDMAYAEGAGREAADFFMAGLPLIYASARNAMAARYMKIAMNETGKTAAFWNAFSELNHNEMMSFTGGAEPYRIVYLADDDDDPRIKKRMDVMQDLVEGMGGAVKRLSLPGKTRQAKLVGSIILAHWAAYHRAVVSGQDPASTALVERFKGLL